MKTKKITKVLVANRGEIALRIIRAAKELDLKTVAIYSEVDEKSPHVQLADEAYCVGKAEAKESYLVAEKVLAAAKMAKADAIHPGFGFLSENADFAKRCEKEGIVFIGPSPEAIELMGDKVRAREAMIKAGVPVVPGSQGAIKDINEAKQVAKKIGFPVILKAAAGGGGKGMRVAQSEQELETFFLTVQREAKNFFNDDTVFLEKFAKDPHHIEVQIIADQHGNVCHLFERECSVQRRHQKVIEEAPAPFLEGHNEIREALFKVAIEGAQRIGYTNAGTMEFVMDGDRNFYFLEMNTRIQVEHPVTEMITGIDIVKEQIRIAQGEKLSFTQKELSANGWAIESRLYAENPHSFLPAPGPVKEFLLPGGPFVRIDSGLLAGQEIPMEYDPMIAKISTWGRTRAEAIQRMSRALGETAVAGCLTNIELLQRIFKHPIFRKGNYTTSFIADHKEISDDTVAPISLENEEELYQILSNLIRVETHQEWKTEPANWWQA
ncbi:MAG: acetyl-CoA carboxylase biotin carboxylase subunit [Oligoflexia bacterium]|nr:acetyl-CoA carboxylase biotin carboxylase subunit [Oligoflexia bacterium]